MNPTNKGERQRQLETPEHLGDETEVDGGSAGGNLARDKGREDERKRAFERPAGATRVRKSDEK